MQWNTFTVLILIALIMSIAGIIKPQWPLVAVSVLLVCVALLVSGKG